MSSSQDLKERVIIFDTTLRDGEQSPGASMNAAEKLQVAMALRDLGVDVIELGFPIASPGDFEAVFTVAQQLEGPTLCALARATHEDIDACHRALAQAKKKRLHVFLATSPLHREHKLKMSREEVLKRSVEAITYGRGRFDEVQFSPEDAARTEPEFLVEVVERVIEAGATTINIPDTVGYAVPVQFAAMIADLKKKVRGIEKVVLSVHCHNDLGLAVANSLAAVKEGARQIECTINGIGERAGNCALEEVVMALRTRHDYFGVGNGIRTERLYPTSRLLSNVTGMHVQRNKAVVGLNAFAHEAGIHQHGVLMHRGTYEIMRAEDVGFTSNSLVLGKHSGRHLLREKVKQLGYHLEPAQLDKLYDEVKAVADKKKDVHDSEVEALIRGQIEPARPAVWRLVSLTAVSGTGVPSAAVCLKHSDGRQVQHASCGDGPGDAVFKVIEQITGITVRLCEYEITSATDGEEALGQGTLDGADGERHYRGNGASTDIILASANAFLEVINRIAARGDEAPAPPSLKASA